MREALQRHPELATLVGTPQRVDRQAGLTNRVYRLEAENGTFFLRLPVPEAEGTVDRGAEARNIALASELDLALPALFCDCATGVLATRAADVLEERPADYPARLGAALSRLHGSGSAFAGLLDPDGIIRSQRQALGRAPELKSALAPLDQILEALAGRRPAGGGVRTVPSHGDLSPGNCLSTPDRLWLIDWEYSAMADPAWDLAYAILEHGFSVSREQTFLAAYRAGPARAFLPGGEELEAMKARCDAVSALWALEQAARGRDEAVFVPFACERRDRALARLELL